MNLENWSIVNIFLKTPTEKWFKVNTLNEQLFSRFNYAVLIKATKNGYTNFLYNAISNQFATSSFPFLIN